MSVSILEIVLYSVIGLAVTVYILKGILQIVDKKKHPEKYKEKEQKNLDE